MTSGCTEESKDFRDRSAEFKAANAIIVGVSKDNVKRHNKFKAKYKLPFTSISDEEGVICGAYDVWRKKKLFGKEYLGIVRSSYLIDESGKIQATWNEVRVKSHVDAVLKATQLR